MLYLTLLHMKTLKTKTDWCLRSVYVVFLTYDLYPSFHCPASTVRLLLLWGDISLQRFPACVDIRILQFVGKTIARVQIFKGKRRKSYNVSILTGQFNWIAFGDSVYNFRAHLIGRLAHINSGIRSSRIFDMKKNISTSFGLIYTTSVGYLNAVSIPSVCHGKRYTTERAVDCFWAVWHRRVNMSRCNFIDYCTHWNKNNILHSLQLFGQAVNSAICRGLVTDINSRVK